MIVVDVEKASDIVTRNEIESKYMYTRVKTVDGIIVNYPFF